MRTIPYVSPTRPPVTSSAPVTSKCRGPTRRMSAGSARRPTAITTAPSGTLIAKIAGQPSVWVSTPPSSAPDEAPSPPTAAHRPRPRLRSGPSGSAEVMIESVAGSHDRAAEALQRAGGDQQRAGVGDRARQRRQGEQRHPDQEHAPASQQVGRAASQHQESGERERVGVDHPLQAGGREVQPVAHRRERYVDHGDVEDHHEVCEQTTNSSAPVDEARRASTNEAPRFLRERVAFTRISVRQYLSRYKRVSYPGSRHHPQRIRSHA